MEIMLLGIYSFFVWLIFFKFKWLPWNFVSQVIVVTIPIVGLTLLILLLNIVAPSSADVRVVNYVVAVNARVNGMVIEVPIKPNRPIKQGRDSVQARSAPYRDRVNGLKAQFEAARCAAADRRCKPRGLGQQLRNASGTKAAVASQLQLAREREQQLKELAATGAGSQFDYQQAQTNVANLKASSMRPPPANRRSAKSSPPRTPKATRTKSPTSRRRSQRAESQLADAEWRLEQTVYRAPANGTVVALSLRPGAMAVPLPITPAMTFVEDEQWIMAIFKQNEVRKIKPGRKPRSRSRCIRAGSSSARWTPSCGPRRRASCPSAA